jgi:ribonuclease BN (tRNA processing enzyme)
VGEGDPHGLDAPALTVVGCGTAAPDGERVCSGYWLETRTARILFDCGAGVVHNLARFTLAWPEVTHLALTHFHNDHIGDVPMLLFALKHGVRPRRSTPFQIIGPIGTRARLAALTAAFGAHVSDPGFALTVHELGDGATHDAGDVALSACRTPHTDTSIAYRARTGDMTIGYTGDTGPSARLGEFMAGVDELIAECSLPDAEAMDLHLTPKSLAAIAQRAAPGRLVATHVYPQLDRQSVPELLAAHGWAGETIVAADGLRLR